MKKLFILLGLMFVFALSSVMGANCVGNPTNDSGGCTLASNVVQTADITFSTSPAITVSGGTWNCNGYKLIGQGKNVGTLIYHRVINGQNVQFYNCDISDTGTVWYLQHPQTSGTMSGNFLNNSVIDNVGTVMQFDGLNHASYGFSITNNGMAGNTITNSDYGMVSTGMYNQDGTGAGIFKNNDMTGGEIGVRIGHTSTSYSMPNEGTLGNWVISGNHFHNMNQAGVWVMQGSGGSRLATISNNNFDNSDLLLQRSNVATSGNTFTSALGQNGCIEPVTWGTSSQHLVWNSYDIPMCNGNYTTSSSIVAWSGNIYPQTAHLTTLTSSGQTGIETTSGTGDGYNRDNIQITDLKFVNYTNAIYLSTDCYNHAFDPISDTMQNWRITGNDFVDYDKNIAQTTNGIYITADDHRYCHINNMTLRDNTFTNITNGVYLNGISGGDYIYSPYWNNIEISFSDFVDTTNGIIEEFVFGSDTGNNKMIVFNSFLRTNNTVPHSGFQWFGNTNLGGSYIQDQNSCQKPDLVSDLDMDVTFCSGTYQPPPSTGIWYPFNNVNIFCDNTVLVDNVLHSSTAMLLSALYYTGSHYKTAGASGISIEGCTFQNFSSGVQFQGSSASSNIGYVSNIELKYNTFNNLDWGVYLYAGSDYTYTRANNWYIHHNNFNTITNEGIFARGDVGSNAFYSMYIYDWVIDNNQFTNTKYGVYLSGDEYSTTGCYDRLYNFNITNNVFHNNENHIRLDHPDPVQCPTQSPRDIDAHYNIFARDFSAFAVLNYAGTSQDFTYNNWGTGFTGIIDQAIFDDYDASQYGLISYIPIIGYTLQYGTPLAIQENWEEALATDSEAVTNLPITYQATGYDSNIAFNGNEKWLLARSNAQARGNVYLTDEDLCINFNCYKAQVDSLDINPQYARVTRFFPQTINLTSDTEIRFKTYFDSDYWDSGGAMIFRNANDQVLLKIDLGITNETNYATAMGTTKLCSIASVTGTNLTGRVAQQDQWHSYTFTLQDVVDNCYSSWGNIFTTAKQIDRIEFVFGGKKNGVLGDVIWYLDDIAVENVDFNTPPSNTPPSGATVRLQETFGQGFNFDVTATDCLVSPEGYDHTQFSSHTPKYVGGDNDWICWLNSSTGSPTIHYEDSSDTLHVSSDLGIMHTVSGSVNPTISSWATSGNYDLDMSGGNADYFLFTCDMSNQTHGNSYLLVGSNTATYIDETKSAYISLTNGGCVYNDTLPYQNDQYDSNKVSCCELMDIAGDDCSGGKTKIEFSEQDVEDACFDEGVGDLSFIDIDRVEFVTLKRTTGADQVFFDDFYMYSLGVIGNNTMPNIYTMDCVPDPTNVSQPVSCGVGVFDPDNNNSEIYTAFDCDTSTPSLDYNWALRGVLPTFSCTFSSENTFTQQTWATDTYHYPTYNSTATGTTSAILEVAPPRPTTGGSCAGYIPQTCSGTCYFTDNFNYDKMISCAGWNGQIADFHPTSNVLGIYGTDVYEYDLEMDKGSSNAIESSSVKSFETKFDIRVNSDDLLNYQIYNKEMNKNVMVSVVDNYVLKAYKETGSLTLQELNPNQWYNVKVVTDFNTYSNYWYVDNNLVGTIDIYEDGVTSARHWDFGWSHTTEEFDIDNFRINILSYQTANQTGGNETEQIEYVYNGDLFCAINWTAPEGATDRFSEQNCADRGFPTNYPLLSLCIPRACLQDVGLMTLSWATANIFRTIIIVSAFILIAPLLVALLKRRM